MAASINKDDLIYRAIHVTPTARQFAWQQMEFYAFVHFTVNTFTDREWGQGTESPEIFNPEQLDAEQWAAACKDAGMTGLILTAKHHDGFCLWPSAYTDHSVKNSPWENGEGDVVAEVASACRKAGLKFGIYLSPWDRHEPSYGNSPVYNQYFKNQLRELLTNYGDIFCVWFDGACGEGSNGKKQVYDWQGYYQIIRELQPQAVISVCGPDVRWCGNEAGHCRQSEWSVVPAYLRDTEKISDKSQQEDNEEFRNRVDTVDEDLGSREKIKHAEKLIWYPAEVNTSIRPGWFYHKSEDDKVKSLQELLHIYLGSVGGNANFLLNRPPDQRGLFHENDVQRLQELGKTIEKMFAENLVMAADVRVKASESRDDNHRTHNLIDGQQDTYWCPPPGQEQATITVDLGQEKKFDKIVLQENIREGQRIEEFSIEVNKGHQWQEIFKETTVGYKQICCFNSVRAREIRLQIIKSRWCPTLSNFEIYAPLPDVSL